MGGTYWPSSSDRWDVLDGRIPLASLGGSDFPGLDAVNRGSEDEFITGLADRIREFGAPLFFRPWREMNRSGTPWGGPQSNTDDDTDGPQKYRQAWRRMHRIFNARGAMNAIWVWSPGCKNWPELDYNHWSNYYPGDAYVDWVACDAYNWGTTTGGGWPPSRACSAAARRSTRTIHTSVHGIGDWLV